MFAQLKKLGLTEEEAKVYLACLEINGGPVSTIARKANMHRVSCYHTLENLLSKQLLSQYNKNGIRYFAPEPPEQLLKVAQEKLNITKGILPELLSIAGATTFRPRIRFYEGEDGVRKVFDESLKVTVSATEATGKRSEILGYTNLESIIAFDPQYFRNYTHEKIARKIKTRYLSPNTVVSVSIMEKFLPGDYDRNLIEILLVNKEQFLFENEILVFGNIVGVVSLKKDELLGLLIESPTIARTMRAVFDLAWLGATAFVAK